MATFWTKKNEDIENEKMAAPWSEALVKGNQHTPRRRPLKVALFDLDGTLVDTEDQYTVFWGATARKYRPDVPRLEYLIKGTTLTQIFGTYFPTSQWQKEITEALDQWEAQMRYDFYPGALEFVSDLKRNGVKKTWYAVRERFSAKETLLYRPHALTAEEWERQRKECANWDITFSVLVPAYRTKEIYLREMIDSLL
ncbi:MAG: HAD hydrolase-like protein, partial [Bacteroidaceae bacterium]|nr:HAD hydrolase-like protein [Bacteroidaceae bacterium]